MVLILVGVSGTLERSWGSLPRKAPPQFSVQFPSTCSRTYKPQEAHRSQAENQRIRVRCKETRTPKHGTHLLANLQAANPHQLRPGRLSQCCAGDALPRSKALRGGQSSPQPDAALVLAQPSQEPCGGTRPLRSSEQSTLLAQMRTPSFSCFPLFRYKERNKNHVYASETPTRRSHSS